MNDRELEKILTSDRPPERSAAYWDAFPRQVLTRLRAAPPMQLEPPRRQYGLAWAAGLALASLAIGIAVGHWHGAKEADAFALLRNDKMLREVLSTFPNRVRAIEQDYAGMHLSLSQNADVPSSTPLWIKICDGENCRAVVTFSGQELQTAAGRAEVLIDDGGNVMLVGDRIVWSSAHPEKGTGGLRIQARALAFVL